MKPLSSTPLSKVPTPTIKKFSPVHKSDDSKIKRMQRTSLQRKFRRKADNMSFASKHGSIKRERFDVGEKVLAKWSDHRMQKFPAVIKGIHGSGKF